jgi:hypothetical protein
MAVALLTDDPPRFRKAVKLYNETLHSYLKWGKGDWAAGGRVPGETSETLRDVFHTEFGLGGLLQVCACSGGGAAQPSYGYGVILAVRKGS